MKEDLKANEKVDFDKYEDACCYMSSEELKRYVKNNKTWSHIKLRDIKEIEALFVNEVYVLLNDGRLYENGKLILENISGIWCMNIRLLFVITNDNYIYSLQDTEFNNYIGNINYKKIVKSKIDLLALTYDGRVKSLTSYPEFIGIIPENFIDVDDIIIEGELGTPKIVKNGKIISLYVSDYNE